MTGTRRRSGPTSATYKAAVTGSYRPVKGGFADLRNPKKVERPSLNEVDALETVVALFDFSVSADRIDALIAGGQITGQTKPERCQRSVGHQLCGLATKKADRAGRCAFHGDPSNFKALGVDEADIYKGTPQEAVLRARLGALKP